MTHATISIITAPIRKATPTVRPAGQWLACPYIPVRPKKVRKPATERIDRNPKPSPEWSMWSTSVSESTSPPNIRRISCRDMIDPPTTAQTR